MTEGIREELTQISPIDDFTGKNWQLIMGEHSLLSPTISPREASKKGLTYSFPLKIKATLINKKMGKEVSQDVFLGDVPQMTSRGTFIINGIERAVINQIVRSPGVYFSGELDPSSGRILYKAEVRPLHGSWLEFEVTRGDLIYARIDRRRKVLATVFLKAMGVISDQELRAVFSEIDGKGEHKYIASTLTKDSTIGREDALLEIYKKLRPGEPVLLENAESLFQSLFLDGRRYDLGRVGRFKINKRLGLTIPNDKSTWVLTKQDVVSAINYLIGLQNGVGKLDDIDHLANRRLRRVGELVAVNAFRVGLLRLERSIKEKMSLISPDDKPLPATLINARPLIASLNEFFRSNQLSTILDDTNPLSEIDNLRRVSVLGPGGINRERASFSIRDVNASQYGRIDPVRSPEGPNIGLVTYLALYARVNEFGFIETPYKKVEKVGKKVRVTNETVYLTADDEEDHYITHSGVNLDKDGFIANSRVALRYMAKFIEGPASLVEYIDVTPRQVIGASASLIPFLANDEGNRALMGSNMQCQSVPLVNPESPIVGTGMEKIIASGMGRVLMARHAGVIEYADAQKVVVKLTKKPSGEISISEDVEIIENGKNEVYYLTKFRRTAHSTCYNQKLTVSVGDKVKEGTVLADASTTVDGEMAIGQNVLVAFMTWGGQNYEDAIVLSERLVKESKFSSIHIEEFVVNVRDTKLGPEITTHDIPNVGEGKLKNLDEDGIVRIGAEVRPGDILVGKITPKGETQLTPEERLLRSIFGEKSRDVKDTSKRMENGKRGRIISVKVFSREKGDKLESGIIKRIHIEVAQLRNVSVGDKLAGRHGNKGVISIVLPEEDMPYMPDGTPIDIVLTPLGVPSRMNLGQILEIHLGLAAHTMNYQAIVPPFAGATDTEIKEELALAGFQNDGKITLFDGRNGQKFDQKVAIGYMYILKLHHMVEDKIHMRSIGPYSLITQQPLGGKAQGGGQRFGEMEVWALLGHGASYTLREILTVKSDDIQGRSAAFDSIVQGERIGIPNSPASFNVLLANLRGLALDVTLDRSAGVPLIGREEEEEEGK